MKLQRNMRNDTDFLIFLAIILIINWHLDILYPIKHLATGGAIGPSLFFMLSAYGLYFSFTPQTSFLTFISNRIKKIYPSVWLELLIIFIHFYNGVKPHKGIGGFDTGGEIAPVLLSRKIVKNARLSCRAFCQ